MRDDKQRMPVGIGLDDGYAYTKIALPDGRVSAIASRARFGRANVTWLDGGRQRIFEYETEDRLFAVGALDGEPTSFDGYPFSGLNRAIVQHALQAAGLGGETVHAVSGLPVGSFYLKDGSRRADIVERKRASLTLATHPIDGRLPASIRFHEVIPEALAAWYDHVITGSADGAELDVQRLSVPVAVVDIGGRTTDVVVVADQAVRHDASGSLRCGLLDVKRQVADAIRARFDLEEISDRVAHEATRTGRIRLFGKTQDVTPLVRDAHQQLIERLHAQTQRQLGRGAELDQILFVGGGAVVLADAIKDWFPNQSVVPEPAFANARGMLKYLRYVCPEPEQQPGQQLEQQPEQQREQQPEALE